MKSSSYKNQINSPKPYQHPPYNFKNPDEIQVQRILQKMIIKELYKKKNLAPISKNQQKTNKTQTQSQRNYNQRQIKAEVDMKRIQTPQPYKRQNEMGQIEGKVKRKHKKFLYKRFSIDIFNLYQTPNKEYKAKQVLGLNIKGNNKIPQDDCMFRKLFPNIVISQDTEQKISQISQFNQLQNPQKTVIKYLSSDNQFDRVFQSKNSTRRLAQDKEKEKSENPEMQSVSIVLSQESQSSRRKIPYVRKLREKIQNSDLSLQNNHKHNYQNISDLQKENESNYFHQNKTELQAWDVNEAQESILGPLELVSEDDYFNFKFQKQSQILSLHYSKLFKFKQINRSH